MCLSPLVHLLKTGSLGTQETAAGALHSRLLRGETPGGSLVPLPMLTSTMPARPAVAAPEPSISAPLLPSTEVPELKTSAPLTPEVPELIDRIVMAPLDVAVPSPV